MKRQACNKINWFEHGRSVALKGQRLDADAQLTECKKVESDIDWGQLDLGFKEGMKRYCEPEGAYQTGKLGQTFNGEMCDPIKIAELKKRHVDGVRAYCQPDNGYREGSSGREYTKICPPNLEKGFLTKYRQGRAKYLRAVIADKRREIGSVRSQLTRERQALREVQRDQSRHARYRPEQTIKKYDSYTNTYSDAENPKYEDWQEEGDRLESLERKASSEVGSLERRLDNLESEVSKLQIELNTL